MCKTYFAIQSPKTGHFVRLDAAGVPFLDEAHFDLFCAHAAPRVAAKAKRQFVRRFDLVAAESLASSAGVVTCH
jgi:hypothetical protein